MRFDPPVALASLSGRSDADWARTGAPYAGAAFLGGIAVDERTREAASRMVDRDREEFLPPDPIEFIDRQLASLADTPIRAGFNVRAVENEALRRAAAVCAAHDAIFEVNAHCRQDEICATGAGQALLRDSDGLCEQVATASEAGPDVSVKVRTEVEGVDLPALAADCEAAGADLIHLDAMDSEPVVGDVVDATECFVIANNEVRDRESVEEYLRHGADAVSVGRPSDEPAVLERVRDAAVDWFADRSDHAEVEP